MSGEHEHPESDVSALVAQISALTAQVAALQAKVDALPAGGGSLPSGSVGNLTVTGKLTVRGEIDLFATRSGASRALNIINPAGSAYDKGYPMIRWERETSAGQSADSRKFLFALVTHEKPTDTTQPDHNHFSMYRRTKSGGRESVFDYDFGVDNVGGTPPPYLDIENTIVRLTKNSRLEQ